MVVMLFGAALFVDSNGYLGEVNTEAVQAGTFLGTGVEVSEGPCIDGTRLLTKRVTLFGIQVGESWADSESC